MSGEFFDDIDNWLNARASEDWGIALEVFGVIYCFFALAIVCDEHLAPALETLCIKWGIREDVAGATFLAFGSAAPEIVINAVTTIKSQVTSTNSTSLGISAIIGSGMIAFSFIPATCVFFSELELNLKRRPLLRDEICYAIALLTLCIVFHDGKITLIESIWLMIVYFGYLSIVVMSSYVRQQYRNRVMGIPLSADESFVYKARKQLEEHRSSRRLLLDSSPNSRPETPRPQNDSGPHTPRQIVVVKRQSSTTSVISVNENVQYEQIENINENGDITRNERTNTLSPKSTQIQKHSIGNRNPIVSGIAHALIGNDEDMEPTDQDAEILGKRQSIAHTVGPEIEEETGIIGKIVYVITLPLQILFKCTCPPAGEDESCESLYLLTFMIAVFWVAVFSFILSSIIQAWVDTWDIPQALFGVLLVAIGAEIPDTIESVTMAKKGYGSMAVANCQGTQVINIGIGLGLPWFITNLTGNDVEIAHHNRLQVGAFFQAGIVSTNLTLLLGMAIIMRKNKASLTRWKAITLIIVYFLVIGGYTIYMWQSGYL